MHGIYAYIPDTNYVPREYSVTAILLLLFMVLISLVPVLNLLCFHISTFRSVCAVPNMAVFCSSFTSCFPGMLLTYFLNDSEIVPVAPIITGITFVFTFHMRCVSVVRSSYFRIFSASILITFLSPQIATSINIHVPFSLSRIIMSGFSLLLLLLLLLFITFVQGTYSNIPEGNRSYEVYSVAAFLWLRCTVLQLFCGYRVQCCSYSVVTVYSVAANLWVPCTVLQLFCGYGVQCCSCSVVTAYGTCRF